MTWDRRSSHWSSHYGWTPNFQVVLKFLQATERMYAHHRRVLQEKTLNESHRKQSQLPLFIFSFEYKKSVLLKGVFLNIMNNLDH